MVDEFAKEYLHNDLRRARAALLWKLDGLSEYDVRRPLTDTGTNLLGLVKHVAFCDARYLGEVFDRPFPDTVPRWDDDAAWKDEHWVTEHETREQIVGLYRRVGEHTDATIKALAIDAPGFVPWWPRPHVKLFNVMVHVLNETNRHAGHADILREQLDGAVGAYADGEALHGHDRDYWKEMCAKIERAAKAAEPDHGPTR
ncbi:DinB family protein [Streptomyces odontomachi]|uniref:DinB family protein n=1 Tax=Streptomyces odontomachi TaxID=2944940 RepID=UPI00210B3C3D|nr:DinB family protein [Streptomyces sp. ODS25]